MSTLKNPPTLARIAYHSIAFNGFGHQYDQPTNESLYILCRAEWRGRPAIVSMLCERYSTDSGWSDWRIYADDAREDTDGPGGRGPALTDTARRRLSDACRPLVREWIDSPNYRPSRRHAFANALRHQVAAMRSEHDARSARQRIAANSHEIEPAAEEILLAAIDIYEQFCSTLRALEDL